MKIKRHMAMATRPTLQLSVPNEVLPKCTCMSLKTKSSDSFAPASIGKASPILGDEGTQQKTIAPEKVLNCVSATDHSNTIDIASETGDNTHSCVQTAAEKQVFIYIKDDDCAVANQAASSSKVSFLSDAEVCPVCLVAFDEIPSTVQYYKPHQRKTQITGKYPNTFSSKNGCRHTVCTSCMRAWVLEQLHQKQLPVRCPVCRGGSIDYVDIEKLLSAKDLCTYLSVERLIAEGHKQYEEQEIDAILRNDLEVFGFVTCPGCGMAVQKEGAIDDLKCRCGMRFCYLCGETLGKGFLLRLLIHQCSCKGRARQGRRPVFFTS